jgi:molybdate/tungstate transport system substrate-binding protein
MVKRVIGVLTTTVVLVAGCGHSEAHGSVQVLYAGSLVNLMEKQVGPKFNDATGYTFQGAAAGSVELANDVKSQSRRGDVFISAAPSADNALMGSANGDWVSWYASFAEAPLVIGYNPQSKFANDLKTKPWYEVIGEPGFQLGRTDPNLDPKGKLTVQALQQAEQTYHDPGFAARVEKASQVFPEQDLLAQLQSGKLDAGFFYRNETAEKNIPSVDLGEVKLAATYTVTVLNQAPDQAGAIAFVGFLLGDQGKAVLAANGLTVAAPSVSGDYGAVPAALRSALPRPSQ